MNREAFEALSLAQAKYLEANGWRHNVDGSWTEPKGGPGRRRGRTLDFGHAVNSQLFYDRNWVEMPPPPTLDEGIEFQYVQIRREWGERHERGDYRSPRQKRQFLRGRIRTIARSKAESGIAMTRVEKRRLERALHAKHHREKGCSCGKEGPPY